MSMGCSAKLSMRRYGISAIIICSLCCASVPVFAAATSPEEVLPTPSCGEGWVMEEKVTLYTRDTLFDRIDGEAELYFPYGFEVLASARYANRQNPQIAVEADVYKMGSLLDAFGMYANYRRPDDSVVKIGAEGFLSSSQLLFYQDRYFVRLQASGTSSLGQDIFLACAQAVSQNLPHNAGKPGELEAFMIPAVVQRSERYIAQSLLGYAFFRRGLTAAAILEGEQVQVFIVPEESGDAARRVFDQYGSYLKASGQEIQVTETADRISLVAVDPLYGNVFVEQAGRYIVGAVKVKDISAAKQLVEQLRRRLLRQSNSYTWKTSVAAWRLAVYTV